jgi:uncharacterized protein YlxW (UPF0749 family)
MARGDAIQGRGTGRNTDVQLPKDFDRIREKVEKLTGERGDATKTLSAVRRGEFTALAGMAMQSTQIASSPTAAHYNALQADIATIFELLQRISNARGTAVIPKV